MCIRDRLNEDSSKRELCTVTALELEDGTILTGKSSELMDASAAVIINAIKYLAGIADGIYLLSPVVLEPIQKLKEKTFGDKRIALSGEEILIALSICAATNPMAEVAMSKLPALKGCQAHSTTILSSNDEQTFRKLGIDITCDAEYQSESLFLSLIHISEPTRPY